MILNKKIAKILGIKMNFFTSDTHFGDNGIIKREIRPFKNFKQFEKKVIKLWNKQAKKNDTIYSVGDFFNYNKNDTKSWKNTLKLAKKIHAKIIIIVGNNEERIIKNEFDNNFENFKQILTQNGYHDVVFDAYININEFSYYLNHYPINKKDNYLTLFGHTHRSTGLWKPFGLNVGCDLNYFKLYSEDDIYNLSIEKQKFWDIDENNNIM